VSKLPISGELLRGSLLERTTRIIYKNESDGAPAVNFNSARPCSFSTVSRFCAKAQAAQFCAGK
jgi:hypothetical protein